MKVGIVAVMVAGSLAIGAGAQQKKTMPDAQVEANVLRALASAPELSTQDIKSTTVYGVVTLSGAAIDEASRAKAEQLASRAEGVVKVVDELTLGGSSSASVNAAPSGDPNAGMILQSDGTYAPPDQSSQAQQAPASQPDNPAYETNGGALPPPPPAPYGGNQYPPQARRPMYNGGPAYPAPMQGGQEGGRQVTIPAGSMVRIRINQGLSTHYTQPGAIFDGTVLNDVLAEGAVAIPRGAAVQGTVVDVKDAGALKGRGELALQLTRLSLGGQSYTLVSDTWERNGKDKTVHTVNSAVGLGALGAVLGAVAGGGAGAAIGAGVGGAAGVASSAASPSGKVIIPPEAVLTFHLAQPEAVTTVSQQEMARLSYAAGPGQPRPVAVRRRYYPEPYYGPVYYGR